MRLTKKPFLAVLTLLKTILIRLSKIRQKGLPLEAGQDGRNFFINLIRIICKQPKCCIINNNFLSSYFKIKRGVTQDDPLSPTIFILCIEYMALLLCQSRLYKGLVIEKHCFKVALFADNAVVYLNSNLSRSKHVFDIINVFSDQSGCQVNMNKSNAFYIGSSRKTIFKPFTTDGLTWQTNTIKYLGVNIPINHGDNISFVNENFFTYS